ncbi:hypothetical protein FACS189499_04880 [Clostridia bacterium]|nr:hypothetical protein FACS189499_04880 [Clostridia bacterium]
MKNLKVMSGLGSTINKMGFRLKKHSPEILIVAGVIGTVVSAVIACKATTKISGVLEKSKEDIEKVHDCKADKSLSEEYTDEDARKDLAVIYVQTGVKLAKLYAPAVILGALSITGIIASNNILRKRNVALAAAYATVDKGFKEYRNRVVERFGEEIDRELKYNIKARQIENVVVGEDGKEKKVKETILVADDPNTYSSYARFFDDGCIGWEKDSEYNLMFLRGQQNYANDKLKADGFFFLNDAYDMLGIPRTKQGQIVGWIYDTKNPIGDNYVDFGIYDVHREQVRDFVNGYERAILLDFNVDGNILDLI